MLLIDCLLLALDAHMLSTRIWARAQGARSCSRSCCTGQGQLLEQLLGPGPISMMAEHTDFKGKQEAINRQYITSNLAYYMAYLLHICKKMSKSKKRAKSPMPKWVLNAIVAPNPTQYTKSGEHNVKTTQNRDWSEIGP